MTGLVRKSMFDIIAGRVEGAVVADLYCGTGTLGLEALSRGAGRCFFADRDRGALALLERSISELGLEDRCILWRGDLTVRLAGWLDRMDGPLDLAFVDPPYADARKWSWDRVARTMFAPLGAHLADDGLVALRLPGKTDPPRRLGPLVNVRARRYGDMTLVFLQRRAEGE